MVSTPIPRSSQPISLKHRMTMEPPCGPRGGRRRRRRRDDEGMTAHMHEQEQTARSRGEQARLPPPLTALTRHPGATSLLAMWQPNNDRERRRCPTHGATTKPLTWHPSMPRRRDFLANTPPTDDDAHTRAPTPIYTMTPAPTNDKQHAETHQWQPPPTTHPRMMGTTHKWRPSTHKRWPSETRCGTSAHPDDDAPPMDNDAHARQRRGTTPTEMTPCRRTANEATTDERQRVPTPMYVPPVCLPS